MKQTNNVQEVTLDSLRHLCRYERAQIIKRMKQHTRQSALEEDKEKNKIVAGFKRHRSMKSKKQHKMLNGYYQIKTYGKRLQKSYILHVQGYNVHYSVKIKSNGNVDVNVY